MTEGFTLAEVLITLAIIGVVAALTIPTLTANYEKHQVVTKLKKFYSVMNQAIKLSEVDNGDAGEWVVPDGRAASDVVLAFYNTYLADYIKTLRIEEDESGYLIRIYMPDGSIAEMGIWSGVDINLYNNAKCMASPTRRCAFDFQFRKTSGRQLYNTTVEPYSAGTWDGTREGLKNHPIYGCVTNGVYCAKLIQLDGWEIKDDYPW